MVMVAPSSFLKSRTVGRREGDELTGEYFEINFLIKIPFQEYILPVSSFSTIPTIVKWRGSLYLTST